MHSILLISKDQSRIDEYIHDFCKKQNINPIDINRTLQDENLGIENIREIVKKIYLKPINSLKKAVVINNFSSATLEAQSALLKVLEEPPSNTYIILCADNEKTLLPTLLSRCKIIVLDKPTQELSQELLTKYDSLLKDILNASIGEKLKIAQDLAKNKDESISYLTGLLYACRELLIKEHKGVDTLEKIQETYLLLVSTNINLRLLLEHLFIQI